jgi:hypothetical protein
MKVNAFSNIQIGQVNTGPCHHLSTSEYRCVWGFWIKHPVLLRSALSAVELVDNRNKRAASLTPVPAAQSRNNPKVELHFQWLAYFTI